jgi:hypothetical protein
MQWRVILRPRAAKTLHSQTKNKQKHLLFDRRQSKELTRPLQHGAEAPQDALVEPKHDCSR